MVKTSIWLIAGLVLNSRLFPQIHKTLETSVANKNFTADLLLMINNNNPLLKTIGSDLGINMMSLIMLKDKKLHKIFVSGNKSLTYDDLIQIRKKFNKP